MINTKILLISGHGAGDPGAVSGSYQEAKLTREVVKLVSPKLGKHAKVTVYPSGRDAVKDIQNGAWQAGWNYDYLLEIHFNSGGGTGSEIYVTQREAGITVEQAILKKLEKFYRNRGVKRTDFLVIKTAKNHGISSALLEVCFVDSKADMETYKKNKAGISDAIVAGVVKGFNLKSE